MIKIIHVIDDYYIQGSRYDYTLSKKVLNKKTGKYLYRILGYYGDIPSAIEGLRQMLSRELVAKKDMELYDAVIAFKSIKDELTNATKGLK